MNMDHILSLVKDKAIIARMENSHGRVPNKDRDQINHNSYNSMQCTLIITQVFKLRFHKTVMR
jgi:hypothetical protein